LTNCSAVLEGKKFSMSKLCGAAKISSGSAPITRSASEKLNLAPDVSPGFVGCGEALMKSAGSKVRPDLPMLSAVIAHSQIVVMLPSATAQRLPANFDAVDITILEWIAAEGRRFAPVYLPIRR
jgi:hypothetical protein